VSLAILGFVPPRQVAEQGHAEIERALALDERLGEAHAAQGLLRALFDFDWDGAGRAFDVALLCEPGSPVIHRLRAACFLVALLRLDEAEAEARRALELDPICPESHFIMALILFFRREYTRAEESIRMTVELGSASPNTYWIAGMVAALQGKYEAAIANCEKASQVYGSTPLLAAGLGMVYGWAGRTADARLALQQIEDAARTRYVSPIYRAMVYVGLRETDAAFEWLDRAVECRDPHILHLPAKPVWDSLRRDPRFTALLRKMRLAQ
jgi:tetratricopeptide (TPR) repeat protein